MKNLNSVYFQNRITFANNKIVKNKKDANAYYSRGNSKYYFKDYKGAIADYTKAIELKYRYTEAYNSRGLVKFDLQDYIGAIADYTKAIELNPNYADAYKNIGVAKYYLGDYDGAIADLNKAIELNCDSDYASYFINEAKNINKN